MKIITFDEFRPRIRRTVTNKFSTLTAPRFRKELREKAFDDKEFCYHVNKAVERLSQIERSIEEARSDNHQTPSKR